MLAFFCGPKEGESGRVNRVVWSRSQHSKMCVLPRWTSDGFACVVLQRENAITTAIRILFLAWPESCAGTSTTAKKVGDLWTTRQQSRNILLLAVVVIVTEAALFVLSR